MDNIEDHIAYACDCGSVKFNLLKSGLIECAKCGVRFGKWRQQNPSDMFSDKTRAILEEKRNDTR